MNSNFPSTRQWVIRRFPWASLVTMIGLIAFFAFAMERNQLSLIVAVPLVAGILVVAFYSEYAVCELDLDRRVVTLHHTRIWRTTRQKFSFGDLLAVSIDEISDSDGSTYRLSFALKNGEIIPLTSISSSGKRRKQKLAQSIVDFINQVQIPPVRAALDGIIRIQQEGETDGIRWKTEIVLDNENVPITRWQTNSGRLPDGFLLIIPAKRSKPGSISKGLLGSVARMMYKRYLHLFAVSVKNLAGFETAEIIKGDQFGLGKELAILTSNKEIAKDWLTIERVRRLSAWRQNNPLNARRAESDPHLLVSPIGLALVFRGNFSQKSQVDTIAFLGATLIRLR